jgi:hypothetical protein
MYERAIAAYDAYQAEVAVSQQNKSREEGREFQA